MINVSGVPQIAVAKEVTKEELMEQIMQLKSQLETVKEKKEIVKKNHKMSKASATRKYVLLTKSLANWGVIPQQQSDIATLLTRRFTPGQEYSEQEVFDALVDDSGEYKSLYTSKQDPTYLFRYYRGLDMKDGKHAGFIKRGFLKVIG